MEKKTDAEWEEVLSPEQFKICRQGGTEPPFSGQYLHNTDPGIYSCVCCHEPLFDSTTKFDSGSGWPSFWKTHLPSSVITALDKSHGSIRTEIRCSRCQAHLGHVFNDGPLPTGLRYCINSVSLKFVPKSEDTDSVVLKE